MGRIGSWRNGHSPPAGRTPRLHLLLGPDRRRQHVIAGAVLVIALLAPPARGGDAGATAADGDRLAAPVVIPNPLTLEEAVDIFRTHGFDLLLADAAVASARGDLVAASAFPNPLVSGMGGTAFAYNPHLCDTDNCSATAFNFNVSDQGLLVDLVVGKRRLRIQGASAALEAARRSRVDAERLLLPAVREQYTQAALASAVLAATREVASRTADTFGLVQRQFDSGAASEADLARAEVAKLDAERAVDSATETLTNAKAALGALLGARDSGADFELGDPLRPFAIPAALREATLASLREQALSRRPDLAAARAQVQSAVAALDLAQRERFPDVSLSAQYQQQGTGQEAIQPSTATFGLSLPLPVLYQNQGEIIGAEADLRTRKIGEQKLTAQVVADVTSAFAAYQSARDRVQRMESRMLDRARRARDLVEYRHQKGAASLFEFLDAQRTFVATQTEYYQDLGDYWSALYKLEQATALELDT